MKRFKEDSFEEEDTNIHEDERNVYDKINLNEDDSDNAANSSNEYKRLEDDRNNDTNPSNAYKRLEDDEKKDNLITPSMKIFRTAIGGVAIAILILYIIFGDAPAHDNYKAHLTSGKISGVNVGDVLTKNTVNLNSKNYTIDTAGSYGKIELSIWNFEYEEDGDYVEVLVNGSPQGVPFQIVHKAVKVSVPDKAVIQVRGIRDGSNNGITYAVFFNKTGETYLNRVPLNATNTYTLKTSH